jgi:hypothetical protein
MTPNPSPSPLAMVAPAPKEPKFFPRDHDCSATSKKQEPCPGGVMGQTPSSVLERGTPAAQMAAVPSPPSHSKISEISEAEACEHSSMLQNPPSSSEKQSRPSYSVSLSDHEFQAMFPEGDLSSTTDDLACDSTEIDNLDFEHTSPWSHYLFEDFGNNSDKQSD